MALFKSFFRAREMTMCDDVGPSTLSKALHRLYSYAPLRVAVDSLSCNPVA